MYDSSFSGEYSSSWFVWVGQRDEVICQNGLIKLMCVGFFGGRGVIFDKHRYCLFKGVGRPPCF